MLTLVLDAVQMPRRELRALLAARWEALAADERDVRARLWRTAGPRSCSLSVRVRVAVRTGRRASASTRAARCVEQGGVAWAAD